MRLSKIQKFLKENNINYEIIITKNGSNEFAEIHIKDNKTRYTTIEEITGIKGNKPSGIMIFYRDIENKINKSESLTSQSSIISRLQDDIERNNV